jgi:hypothetical protein
LGAWSLAALPPTAGSGCRYNLVTVSLFGSGSV